MTAPAWTASHPVSNPVALYDGRVVASDSLEWMEQTRVAAILAMSPEAQLSHNRIVERKHGPEARAALENRCRALEPHYVASLPTSEERHAYLTRVQNTRGRDVRDVLEARARDIFARRLQCAEAMAHN